MTALALHDTPGIPVGEGVPGRVSVIMPAYNRAHCIGRAIRSALEQSYPDVEVVVGDDGSSDDTANVVQSYGPRVRYFRQPNRGAAAARNLALHHASGEFIAFLDSDDWWDPWKIAAQVAVLRHRPDIGMVWTDMCAVTDDGELKAPRYLRTMYTAHDDVDIAQVSASRTSLADLWSDAPADLGAHLVYAGDLFAHMFMGSLVHTSTVLLRRTWAQQVGGFDATKRIGEDYEYHFKTTGLGAVALIDAPSMQYVIGMADQITAPGTFGRRLARATLQTVLEVLARSPERITLPPDRIALRLARIHAWLGEEELAAGERGVARRHLWASLRALPSLNPRRITLLFFTLLPAGTLRAVRTVLQTSRGRGKKSVPVAAHG